MRIWQRRVAYASVCASLFALDAWTSAKHKESKRRAPRVEMRAAGAPSREAQRGT
jgi:hypothetical protein